MPSPSATQVLYTQQAALEEFWEYSYNENNFIANLVFPATEVAKQAGPFGKLEIEEMLKQETQLLRQPGAAYARDRIQFANDSYACQEYGYEEVIDEKERRMYAEFLNDPEDFATQRAVNTLLRAREIRVASQVFNTTTFGSGGAFGIAVGSGTWDNLTATPVTDVEDAAQTMFDNSGLWPNAVIMNTKAYRYARRTTELKAAVAASGAGFPTRATDITTQQLAEVFSVDQVLVAGGARNTANVNAAVSVAELWGNHCMVCRIATSSDMKQPAIGRSMHWSEDGSMPLGTVEKYREENKRSDIVRVRHEMDEKLMLVNVGCLINSVL